MKDPNGQLDIEEVKLKTMYNYVLKKIYAIDGGDYASRQFDTH